MVGMDGNSYNAHTSWMTAKSGAPHLKAMAVSGVPGDLIREGTYYLNGIKSLYMAFWMLMTNGHTLQIPMEVYNLVKPYEFLPDLLKQCAQTPPEKYPDLLGYNGKNWRESLDHPEDDGFWDELQIQGEMAGCPVAGLHVSGWFDIMFPGTITGFECLRNEGTRPNDQFLIIGPYTHEANVAPVNKVNSLEFDRNALLDMLGIKVNFFNHYLRGHGNFDLPHIQLYDMGRQSWYQGDKYPETSRQKNFLAAHKLANQPGEPSGYAYDPGDPTPIPAYLMPVNCANVAQRPDLGRFESEVLETALTVSGQVELDLLIEQDVSPVEIIATVYDCQPNGRCLPLTFGGLKTQVVNTLSLKLPYLHHTFSTGSRIGVLIQSTAFPYFVPIHRPVKVNISGKSIVSLPVQKEKWNCHQSNETGGKKQLYIKFMREVLMIPTEME